MDIYQHRERQRKRKWLKAKRKARKRADRIALPEFYEAVEWKRVRYCEVCHRFHVGDSSDGIFEKENHWG